MKDLDTELSEPPRASSCEDIVDSGLTLRLPPPDRWRLATPPASRCVPCWSRGRHPQVDVAGLRYTGFRIPERLRRRHTGSMPPNGGATCPTSGLEPVDRRSTSRTVVRCRWSWGWSTSPPTPSPTAAAISTPTPPWPTGASWWPRAPTWSTWAASRPVRGRARRPGRGAARGSCPSSRPWPPTACGSRSTPATPTPAERAVAAGATLINDVSASLWPVAADAGVGLGGHAHARRPAHDAGRPAATTTWSPRCATSWSAGPTEPRDGGGRGGVDRPGLRVRQDARAQPGLARRPRRAGGHGVPGAGRAVPQGFLGRLLAARTSRRRRRRCRASAVPARAGDADRGAVPADDRLEASLATAVWALEQGAQMVRVHEVAATAQRRQAGGGLMVGRMKGKWAQGIQPRNFAWVIKDKLAICERPGRLRRQPPPGAAPGGDHLDPGAGVRHGRLADPVAPQPAQLRRARASRTCTARSASADDAREVLAALYPSCKELIGSGDEGRAAHRGGRRPARRRRRRLRPLERTRPRGPARHLHHREDHRPPARPARAAASSPSRQLFDVFLLAFAARVRKMSPIGTVSLTWNELGFRSG